MPGLPTGTVTFLFTDLEGSSRLWEEQPGPMREALAAHDAVLQRVVEASGGEVVKRTGDGLHAVFATGQDAVAACVAGQRALQAQQWPAPVVVRVRMAVHTGTAELRGGDYYGPAVNRTARLAAAAHGAQVLLSQTTYDLVRDALPEGIGVRDLGEHRLRDLHRPERVFQLVVAGLPADFAPLASREAGPNNLPLQATRLVGRGREVDASSDCWRSPS
jgi:class 3 adenylate cyclase